MSAVAGTRGYTPGVAAPARSACVFPACQPLACIEHRYFADVPAVVSALDLELDHGDGVGRAAHDAQAATDALLLVNDHVGAGFPGGARELVQRVALDHARQPLHADAVVGADVHAAATEDADGRVDHDVELALQAAPRLGDGLFGAVARLGLDGDAEALLQRQRRDHLIGDGLVIVHHAAAEVRQLDLDGLLRGAVFA